LRQFHGLQVRELGAHGGGRADTQKAAVAHHHGLAGGTAVFEHHLFGQQQQVGGQPLQVESAVYRADVFSYKVALRR